MKISDLIIKFGQAKLSIREAAIPPYILLGGLVVVVIAVISKAV